MAEFWSLVGRQYGVITREQLLALGFSAKEIKTRIANGRLHQLWRGVYAVGRPRVGRKGYWLAAAFACGPQAVLSHGSASALWRIGEYEPSWVEVSVPCHLRRRRQGIRVRRRTHLDDADVTQREGIPVTSPIRTLIDLAPRLNRAQLERAVNEAANLDLVSPDALRAALDERSGQRGVARLRHVLDRRTFRLTDSRLEQLFLPLAERAGLSVPQTRLWLNGFRVDFYFAELGLVVEADSLRYHRTPAQQARDRLRDQAHMAAGLTPLRFTHEQIRYEPEYVVAVLTRVAAQLRTIGPRSGTKSFELRGEAA